MVRLGRHVSSHTCVVNWDMLQPQTRTVMANTDSVCAGCKRTGRSTSGGCTHAGDLEQNSVSGCCELGRSRAERDSERKPRDAGYDVFVEGHWRNHGTSKVRHMNRSK